MFRRRPRCFVNKYKDYSGSLGNVEYLRDLVPKVLHLIEEQSPPERASRDGGLYVGCPGIGYSFYAVSENSEFANLREQCLTKALEYMQVITYLKRRIQITCQYCLLVVTLFEERDRIKLFTGFRQNTESLTPHWPPFQPPLKFTEKIKSTLRLNQVHYKFWLALSFNVGRNLA